MKSIDTWLVVKQWAVSWGVSNLCGNSAAGGADYELSSDAQC